MSPFVPVSVVLAHNAPFEPTDLIKLLTEAGFNRLGEWREDTLAIVFQHTDYYLLAEEAGQLIGFVRLFTDWHTRGYISNLCVTPRCQHRGVGQALMQEMLRVCDTRGVPVLNVYDTSGRPDFYQKLGFESDAQAVGLHRLSPSRRKQKSA